MSAKVEPSMVANDSLRPTLNGELTKAIASLKKLARDEKSDPDVQSRLADLYAMTGFRRQASQLWQSLSGTSPLAARELVMLTDFDRRHPEFLQRLLAAEKRSPDDLSVNLGLAIEEYAEKKNNAAKNRLSRILLQRPDIPEAQGLLGEILVDTDLAALPEWYSQIPGELRDTPEILIACGRWSSSLQQHRMAVWCHAKASQQIPTSYRASYLLSSALTTLETPEAPRYQKLAEKLFQLREQISAFLRTGGKSETTARAIVELLENLHRPSEAFQWLELARRRVQIFNWESETYNRLFAHRLESLAGELSEQDVRHSHPLVGYPEFQIPSSEPNIQVSSEKGPVARGSKIYFEDRAERSGLQFTFKTGRPGNTSKVRMFESTGGGIAIIDYDLDARPDVFLTQGKDWPEGSLTPSRDDSATDVLFRQVGDRYLRVEQLCGISDDSGYGQGCAVGDADNDGFPDLYVANIGQNRFLRNNGDGTFSDGTEDAELTSSQWTTSCLIADLDGDSCPDIYDVNYLGGERVFLEHCNRHRCSTAPFEGVLDEVHWSQMNGRFLHSRLDHEGTTGPGLGIVAMSNRSFRSDLSSKGFPLSSPSEDCSLAVYVGNDGQPDYLVVNTGVDIVAGGGTTEPRIENQGFARGLAVNANGKYTSSMGIASGDVNRDGRLDLFVTNYSGEANSLFLQQSHGFFVDGITSCGLSEHGFPYVGWGTQFLDADCDGDLDLFVANGHVADFESPSVEYAMPMQFFRQDEGCTFSHLPSVQIGDVFRHPVFGRSAVVTDWNRDGAPDLIVGTLASSPMLLTNFAESIGQSLRVKLHATTSARDAIGATVTVICGKTRLKSEMTAGDGFHASQERMLHFGLGSSTVQHCQVLIDWPCGRQEEFGPVPLNTSMEAVEGHGRLWQLPY
ncbi:MAG: FG-GAP-like repeat-containing protein [Planctomycetaceae bacterium]